MIEYLAKQWLMTFEYESKFKQEYEIAIQGVREILLRQSKPSKLFFVGEVTSGDYNLDTKMDHLVCFLPGTLAWKATRGKLIMTKNRHLMQPIDLRDFQLAEELMRSCVEMYLQTQTKLSPEIVFWNLNDDTKDSLLRYHTSKKVDVDFKYPVVVPDDNETEKSRFIELDNNKDRIELDFTIHPQDGHNLLRPETIESLFILYRLTGKQQYQHWGWQIFQQFERFCKIKTGGFASLVLIVDRMMLEM